MAFDDEVDGARKRLEAAMSVEDEAFDDLAALQALLPLIQDKIKSRRLTFQLGDDDDETIIEIVHTATDEALGFIVAQDGEYVFESNLEEFFEDFVDESADSFALRLYETLRADMPKYEVENKR